ncbi:MAG: hypothetical protein ABIN57_08580, partial [Chitinophagaceae bacterium]
SIVEIQIFKFLRQSFHLSPPELKPAFESLLAQLKVFEKNPIEARAFAYLDIVSWLESKVMGQPIDVIIKEKLNSYRTRQRK